MKDLYESEQLIWQREWTSMPRKHFLSFIQFQRPFFFLFKWDIHEQITTRWQNVFHLIYLLSSPAEILFILPCLVMNHVMVCKCVVSYMLFDKQTSKPPSPGFQEEGRDIHVPIWREELAEKLVVWICGPCVMFGRRLVADKLHPTLKAAQVAAARSHYKKLWHFTAALGLNRK